MSTSAHPIDQLLRKIDQTRLPQHVAVIMDGNGRWAKKRGLPRLWGHRMGTKSVREIVETAGQLGVKVLTLYAFSTENWTRPKSEVGGLMRLLKGTLKREETHLDKNNVRLETIGDIKKLPIEVQEQLKKTKNALSKNTGLILVLALNYGGRFDIVNAVNRALAKGHHEISEKMISENISTASYPEPDLLIRTSGEFRVSNFLLWQIAYAELHVTPILWPDFKREHFYQAILDFQSRDRRYGGAR